MENKIPTAEEFLEENFEANSINPAILIEFAKLHVIEALKAVIKEIHPEIGVYKLKDDSSILNAYSLDNIK